MSSKKIKESGAAITNDQYNKVDDEAVIISNDADDILDSQIPKTRIISSQIATPDITTATAAAAHEPISPTDPPTGNKSSASDSASNTTSKAVPEVPNFYCVYLLNSINHRNRFYIGSTNNPNRRLAQHNGHRSQGAKRTGKEDSRPWAMVMIVHGFMSNIAALQFEHALQHLHLTHHINVKDRVINSAGRTGRKKAGATSIHQHLAGVRLLLNSRYFGRMNLKVEFFHNEPLIYEKWIENKFGILLKMGPECVSKAFTDPGECMLKRLNDLERQREKYGKVKGLILGRDDSEESKETNAKQGEGEDSTTAESERFAETVISENDKLDLQQQQQQQSNDLNRKRKLNIDVTGTKEDNFAIENKNQNVIKCNAQCWKCRESLSLRPTKDSQNQNRNKGAPFLQCYHGECAFIAHLQCLAKYMIDQEIELQKAKRQKNNHAGSSQSGGGGSSSNYFNNVNFSQMSQTTKKLIGNKLAIGGGNFDRNDVGMAQLVDLVKPIVPIKGKCPNCKGMLHWNQLVRVSGRG